MKKTQEANMQYKKSVWVIALLVVICLVPFMLYGVSTAYWEVSSKSGWAKGELENLVLTPEGEIILGKKVNRISIDEPSLWCAVRDKKDNIYFGSGTGKIYKLNGDQAQEVFSTGELLVTSLVASKKNEIFAATIPNGKIFKIDRSGKAITFCVLSDMYVWALAYSHKQNILYAATGPTGKIYKIDKDGNATEFYNTKKPNILCLTLDKDNNLYFGTASPGILYRLSADGKPWVLHDFGDSEIRALVLHDENLYVAVNSGVKALPQDFLGAVRAAAEKVKEESEENKKASQESPPSKQPKPVIQSNIYLVTTDNKIKLIYTFPNSYLTDIKIAKTGEILVGTDNTGKIFKVLPDGTCSIPYDMESEQVLTLLMDKKGEFEMIGAGKPGHIFILAKGIPEKAFYTSDVFNAGFAAQWGSLAWKAVGQLALQTRSGNTKEPDETWSDWSDELSGAGKIQSPPGQYIQFRANWDQDKEAILKEVSVAYLVENQAPTITDFKIEDQPAGGGADSPSDKNKVPPRHSVKKITWQVQNPDEDVLGIRIYYREEKETHWFLLNTDKLIMANEFVWNTESIPDGKYLIKIEVTDEKTNPIEKALKDERVSSSLLVDNTKPGIKEFQIDKKKLICHGLVEDNFSYINRIEYAVDGGDWRLVYPDDNLFDGKTERFSFALGKLASGVHVVLVRVFDSLGNMGVVQKTFKTK